MISRPKSTLPVDREGEDARLAPGSPGPAPAALCRARPDLSSLATLSPAVSLLSVNLILTGRRPAGHDPLSSVSTLTPAGCTRASGRPTRPDGRRPALRSGHAAVRPIGAPGARRPAARPSGRTRPTLNEGWTTRDLAAHLVVRERRPDAAAGILLPPLRGHGERVRGGGRRPALRRAGRAGPPAAVVEPGEQPAHRRAGQHVGVLHPPRGRPPGPAGLAPARPAGRACRPRSGSGCRCMARLALRRFPAHRPDPGARARRDRRRPAGGESLRLVGAPGELALFLFGRQRVARVQLDGPAALAHRLRTARLGI